MASVQELRDLLSGERVVDVTPTRISRGLCKAVILHLQSGEKVLVSLEAWLQMERPVRPPRSPTSGPGASCPDPSG